MEEKDLLTAVRQAFPDDVLEASISLGDPVLIVRPRSLRELMDFLRGEPRSFTLLLDLTCVDRPDLEDRFEMVYHLLSLASNRVLRVKTAVPAGSMEVDSLVALWRNADWLEREVFDLFGVRFAGHPDLRRLLLYDGFEGHPLRKDYPLRRRQPRIPPREVT